MADAPIRGRLPARPLDALGMIEVKTASEGRETVEASKALWGAWGGRGVIAWRPLPEERWRTHEGTSCPVDPETKIEIRLQNGLRTEGVRAGDVRRWDGAQQPEGYQVTYWRPAR